MSYPLPDEEDIAAIRQELVQFIETRDAPTIRRRMLDQYVQGHLELDDIAPDRIAAKVHARVEAIVKRGTEADWRATRKLVYRRDGGICHVCGRDVLWDGYECGHIVDRVCGGTDRPSNLVTMCIICNRLKPMHESRVEYLAWIEGGAWVSEIIRSVQSF